MRSLTSRPWLRNSEACIMSVAKSAAPKVPMVVADVFTACSRCFRQYPGRLHLYTNPMPKRFRARLGVFPPPASAKD